MRLESLGRVNVVARVWSRRERRLQLLGLMVGLGVVISVWVFRSYITGAELEEAGYPGVFFLSFLGSVSMVLPIPGLISACGLSVILNPFAIGVLSGVGETLGELSGYAVGYGGGSIVEKRRLYQRVKTWMERRGVLVLFLVSAIPNPIFDVVGIAAGAVRFPLQQFLATVLAGKLVKGLLVAYTCFYGYSQLPWVD